MATRMLKGVKVQPGVKRPEAEFKEFEPRLKFGWFHLKIVFNFSRFKPALN